MGSAVVITPDVQPVTITPNITAHDDVHAPPSFLNTLGREVKSMNPIPMAEGMYKAFTEAPSKAEAEKHGTDFFGLGIDRILAQPAKYAAHWYLDALRGKIPDAYEQALSVAPEAIGQSAGGVVAGKAIASGVKAVPGAASAVAENTPLAWTAARAGLTAGAKEAISRVPIAGPAVKTGVMAAMDAWRKGQPIDALSQAAIDAERAAPTAQAIPEAQATPQAAPAPSAVMQGPERSFDARPTARGEIVDDKAIQDAMRHDLEKHGWRALSEERQKFYADNGPAQTKSQLIAKTKARVVIETAMQQAQQILDEQKISAETPARFTKTVIPKAPVSASPVPEAVKQSLDPNSDLTDILQRSLDAIKARKSGK